MHEGEALTTENSEYITETNQSLSELSFKNYVNSITEYPDSSFDLISIDGVARSSCIKASIPKLKKGGYLMLDNSEREEYQEAIKLLNNFERIDFEGPGPYNFYFWTTTIWKKGNST